VVDRTRPGKGNFGLDASSGRFVDLMERTALDNAVSVAVNGGDTHTEEREKKSERASVPEMAELASLLRGVASPLTNNAPN